MTGPAEDDAPVAVPMPMFPLGSVLFPYQALSLQVFEARYQALVRDCLRNRREFGVVLIERGAEVGGGDVRFGVGTVARMVEAAPFPDGRWLLLCTGTRRVRVLTWLPDDPYPLALVEELADLAPGPEDDDAFVWAEHEVRRALALAAELDEAPAPATVELAADRRVAGYQLAAVAPLGPVDKQRLLEQVDPGGRLRMLAGMAADAADVLAYRLAGR